MAETNQNQNLDTKTVILETRGLTKRFGSETVLSDVNLCVYSGEIFGLIGKSGAGKSTLARCFNYLEKPTAGEVLVGGVSLGGLRAKKLYETRRSMGMIFQQFNLLMQRSVLGNVMFPMEIARRDAVKSKARALELLELVKLSDKVNAFPSTLSGGQKQRVAIARAMALSPRVLICDEATSALDPETTRGILALLREINQTTGVTIIIITHEMPVIESICQRVAILDGSRVVETGAVRDVFLHPKTEAAKALVFGDGRGEALIRRIESAGLTVDEALVKLGIS